MGSHLRVVRPGEPSRLRGGLAASDVAKVRKELPARRLAATQGLRALCVSQAAWHPATATQRWLARKLLKKTFLKRHDPSHPAAAHCLGPRKGGTRQCASAVWVWVSDLLKGFSKGNMD